MEAGTLLAETAIPALAKEYRKAAKANGAFDAASRKTRAELNRAATELSLFSNTVFDSGFNEGLSSFFRISADLLQSLKPLAQVIGKTLKWAFKGLGVAMNLVSIPFRLLSKLFDEMSDTVKEFVGGGLVIAAAGAWILYATRLNVATKAVWAFITASKAMAAVPWIAAALVAEDVGRTVSSGGKDNTVLKELINSSTGDKNSATNFANSTKNFGEYLQSGGSFSGTMYRFADTMVKQAMRPSVDIKIDATGLNDKQIQTQVKHSMNNAMNDIASESKG